VSIRLASRQTGSRNLMGPKTLPTIWHTYMKLVTKYQISVINSCWEKCDKKYLGRTDGRTDSYWRLSLGCKMWCIYFEQNLSMIVYLSKIWHCDVNDNNITSHYETVVICMYHAYCLMIDFRLCKDQRKKLPLFHNVTWYCCHWHHNAKF
jgi:hypothetical protein